MTKEGGGSVLKVAFKIIVFMEAQKQFAQVFVKLYDADC